MDPYECPVCLTYMLNKSPRGLSCLHTFCTQCLERLIQNKKIECPMCKHTTKLKSNDVKELKINFLLQQMKDRETRAAPTPAPSGDQESKSPCQICKVQEPTFYCHGCPKLLCLQCKVKHGKVGAFRSHVVSDLCFTHQDGVTHLCTRCVKPLCTQCMLMEHIHHEAYFVTYKEGIQQLQEKAKTVYENIGKKGAKRDQKLKQGQDISHQIKQIMRALKEREVLHEIKMKEAGKLLKKVVAKECEFVAAEKAYTESRTECSVASASIQSLMFNNNMEDFCDKYTKLMQQAQQAVDNMDKLPDLDLLPEFVPAEACNCQIVRPRNIVPQVKEFKVSKCVLDLKHTATIKYGRGVTFLGNEVVLGNWKDPNHVMRLNKEGKLLCSYYPAEEGAVNGVSIYNNRIYVVQSAAITVISHRQDEDMAVYKPKTDNISKILVKNINTLIISNYKSAPYGKIYQYKVDQDATDVMVQGLDQPQYISLVRGIAGDKYVISESGAHSIRVYDEQWRVLYKFGGLGSGDGQFNTVCATVVTPMDTLLIADCNNNRVAHYTLEGRLLSYVITEKDGIKEPVATDYKEPYLWVSYGNHTGDLKCFKLE